MSTADDPQRYERPQVLPIRNTTRRGRSIARLIFATTLALIAAWMASDYIVSLVWAVLIAITVWPLYRRFAAKMPEPQRRTIAPLIFTVLTGIVLIVPVTLALVGIGREAQTALEWLKSAQQIGIPFPSWLSQIPVLGQTAEAWWRTHLSDPRRLVEFTGNIDLSSLATWSQALGGQLAYRLLLMLMTFSALFGLLRNGDLFATRVLTLMDHVLGDPGERLASKLVEAARATVDGTILVAVGEGAMITVGYVMTGVPHPMLFGLLTIAFAMLPLGAWIAFGIATLVLLFQGASLWLAASLFGFGALVMFIGDNFIQPALIGGRARLPFLWALIGILGGLQTFGLIGLFLGPVIMAALLTIWREWIDLPAIPEDRHRQSLPDASPGPAPPISWP